MTTKRIDGRTLDGLRRRKRNARRALLQFRITEQELESIRETAAHHGLTVGELVRAALGLPREGGGLPGEEGAAAAG